MKASAEAYMDWSLKYGNNSADHIQRYHSIDELPWGTTGYVQVIVVDIYIELFAVT